MLIYAAMIDSPADRDKFISLYDLYEGLLYHIAWNVLHSKEDVEDAVQQTFLRIIMHLDKIVQIDSPQTRSFVGIICRHCCIDILRKQKKAMEVSLTDADELVLQEHVKEDPLLDAFRQLKSPFREILLLRYRHGYSVKEVAKILNRKPETVKKYIQRGKAMLQKALDEEVREDE